MARPNSLNEYGLISINKSREHNSLCIDKGYISVGWFFFFQLSSSFPTKFKAQFQLN